MNFVSYKITLNRFVISCFISIFFATSLFAKTLYVDTNLSVDVSGSTYKYIQPALDAATAGDTILVKLGTYTGDKNTSLDFKGKDLILRSQEGAENTIIDCENRNGCLGFHFHSGETNSAVVDGFTITNVSYISAIRNNSSSPTIINNNISNNSNDGIYNQDSSSPTIINNTISNNYDGIYNRNSSPTIINNTISNNLYDGINNWNSSSPTITNTIIWGNNKGVGNSVRSNPVITYSIVQGGYEGEGNIDQDPLFYKNSARLLENSPAIDAGKQVDVSTDIEGNLRGIDRKLGIGDETENYDIGAYEYTRSMTLIKKAYIVDLNLLENTKTQFKTIQEALDKAYEKFWNDYQYVQTILVKPGTYTGEKNTNLDFKGINLTLRSEAGAENTIIDCENREGCRGFYFHNGETKEAIVDGFTITGGNVENGGGIHNWSSSPSITNVTISNNTTSNDGGGIYNSYSSPSITNVTISNNTASDGGGGIYNWSSSPSITNVTISNNTTSNDGGGIYNLQSSPSITNVTISNNTASDGGGGIYNLQSSPSITNVTISNNTASDGGGGIYNWSSSPSITNVTISNNDASDDGGGIHNSYSSPTLTNVTIVNNTASKYGGGIYNHESSPIITNTIIWGNTFGANKNSTDKSAYIHNFSNLSKPIITYSIVHEAYQGEGNVLGANKKVVDPLFIDIENGDFRLKSSSPAIDAGKNIPGLYSDIRGSIRPFSTSKGDVYANNAFDIGAYEYSGWSNGEEDQVRKLIQDITLNAKNVYAETYEYPIQFKKTDLFPTNDIRHDSNFEVQLFLVNSDGSTGKKLLKTIELDTQMPQEGYVYSYLFSKHDLGDKRIRIEIKGDSEQFNLSEMFRVHPKLFKEVIVGEEVLPPTLEGVVVDLNQAPDFSASPKDFFWDEDHKKLYAKGVTENTPIIWKDQEGQIIPYSITTLWPKELFKKVDVGGETLYTGYEYLINWYKFSLFPGEAIAQFRPEIEVILSFVKNYDASSDTFEKEISLGKRIISAYEPEDGYFIRHVFTDEFFETGESFGKNWRLKVAWQNPNKPLSNHYGLSPIFEVETPSVRTFKVGETITPIHTNPSDPIDTSRRPDIQENLTAFSWNYTTQVLKAIGTTKDTMLQWYTKSGQIISEQISIEWPQELFKDVLVESKTLYTNLEQKLRWKSISEFPGTYSSIGSNYEVILYLVKEGQEDLIKTNVVSSDKLELTRLSVNAQMPAFGYETSFVFDDIHQSKTDQTTWKWKLGIQLQALENIGDNQHVFYGVSDESFSIEQTSSQPVLIGQAVTPPSNATDQKPRFDESLFYYDVLSKKLYPTSPKAQASIFWLDHQGNEIPQVITILFSSNDSAQKFIVGSPAINFSVASLKATLKYQSHSDVDLLEETYFSMSKPGRVVLVYQDANTGQFQKIQAIEGIFWKTRLNELTQEIGKKVDISSIVHNVSCGAPYVYFKDSPIALNTRIEKPYNGYHFKTKEGPIVPIQLDNDLSDENDLVLITYEKNNQICWPSQSIRFEPTWPQQPQVYVTGSAPVDLMSYQSISTKDSILFSDLIYSTQDTANLDSSFQYTAVGEGYGILSFGLQREDGSKTTEFEVVHNISWHTQVQETNNPIALIGEEIETSTQHDATCGSGYLYNIEAPHAMNTQESKPYSGYDQKTRTGPLVPINIDPSPLSYNDFVVVWYQKSKGICWPSKAVRYEPKWPEEPQKYVAGSKAVSIPQNLYSFAEIKYKEAWTDSQIISDQEFVSTRAGRSVIAYGENNGEKTYFQVIQTIEWQKEWRNLQEGKTSYLSEESVDIGSIITSSLHNSECNNGDVYYDLSVHAQNTLNEIPFNGYDPASRTGPIVAMNLDYDGNTDLNNDLVVTWYNKVNDICWASRPVRYLPKWSENSESLIIASGKGSGYLSPLEYKNAHVYVQEDREKTGFNPNEEHARIKDGILYSTREDLNQEGISKPYSILMYQNPKQNNRWEFKTYKVVQEEAPYFFSYDVKAGSLIQPPQPLSSMQACQESGFNVKETPRYAWYKDYNNNLWAKAGVLDPSSDDPEYSKTPIVKALFYERWKGECHPWPYEKNDQGDLAKDAQGNLVHKSINYNIYWPDDPHWITHPKPILSRGAFAHLKSELPEDTFKSLLTLKDQYFKDQADFEKNVQATIGTNTFLTYKANILKQIEKPLGISQVPELMIGETLLKPKYGLPEIDQQCSVEIITDQSDLKDPNNDTHSVKLVDILSTRYVHLEELPSEIKTRNEKGKQLFIDLPYHLRSRLLYDPISKRLEFKGILDNAGAGEPLLLLNVISEKEEEEIKVLHSNTDYQQQVEALATLTRDLLHRNRTHISETYLKQFLSDEKIEAFFAGKKIVGGRKALTSGAAKGTGYVTLAMQADVTCSPLPLSLSVIKVKPELYTGEIKVIYSLDPFEEIVTLRHNGDFGGVPKDKTFEWRYASPKNGGSPQYDPIGDNQDWIKFDPPKNDPLGVVGIDVKGPGLFTLEDKYFIVRYKGFDVDDQVNQETWSEWTRPQLYEGWIKRAVRGINPYEQRVKEFHSSAVDTTESMIMQAGKRYEGDIALNATPENINNVGLIEAYQTILNRGKTLSIDASVSNPTVNDALLLATSRIADFYMLLGNEAFADALDPTIGFGTDQGQYGAQATSLFSFKNQMSSLLEEELALLRGRDIQNNNPVQIRPFYNRLIWNFTSGIDGGEVAYNLNYNLKDQNQDGLINSEDAKTMFPQGHGDAWGHYLTAISSYYDLLRHPQYDWISRSESVLVAGVPIRVDYYDERKFAHSAASRVRVGKEIVHRTYLANYSENNQQTWKSYQDTQIDSPRYEGESQESKKRAWGMDEWATRAAQGAYLDWIVANQLLPEKDTVNTGIAKIDRSTVGEISEIASYVREIQHLMDQADTGLNPLGIASNAIPFDIDPKSIEQGQTHFEQIYQRAENALQNAMVLFDHSNQNSQLIRRQQDALSKFQQNVREREDSYKNQLISIFGYPYANDMGPGGTYPDGYDGPDLYHYDYVDISELMGIQPHNESTFTFTAKFREAIGVNKQGELQEQIREVEFHTSKDGLGLIKPENWTSKRRAPGEIQIARSNLLQALARFQKGMKEYDNLISNIQSQARLLKEQNNVNLEQITVLNETKNKQMSLNKKILDSRKTQMALRISGRSAILVGNAISEGFPGVMGVIGGLAAGVIGDPLSAGRSAARIKASAIDNVLNIAADVLSIAEMGYQHSKEEVSLLSNIRIQQINQDHQLGQTVSQIEQMIRSESTLRLELLTLKENMEQMRGHYFNALAKGQRLIEERERFRKNTAVDIQAHRYKDMAFRIFRNEALQGYEDQFNLANKYVYLAAKAYDFETNLLSDHSISGKKFLDSIVKERTIGRMSSSGSMKGQGLADAMYQMKTNFQLMKGQLGLNNPQNETNRFSLRKELFRIKEDYESNPVFEKKLESLRVDNLWEIPEFRRYARPFDSERIEPGLVIEFSSNITSRMNFFGWPLGDEDSAYSSSHFATKIGSVGVWFTNYEDLPETVRVYLIPVGQDLMRSPSYGQSQIREFRVLDQKLPLVFPLEKSFDHSFWNLSDQLFGNFGEPRKFSTFRAYHDSGFLQENQLNYDTRLIGRSVWNTKWMLIVPGASLGSDAEEGLDILIKGAKNPITKERTGGISDIKLFFKTYSYSGY